MNAIGGSVRNKNMNLAITISSSGGCWLINGNWSGLINNQNRNKRHTVHWEIALDGSVFAWLLGPEHEAFWRKGKRCAGSDASGIQWVSFGLINKW